MLRIEETESEGVIVLALDGTIDMYSSPDLKTRLDEMTKRRAPRIVVDLGAVDFIDSSGLAAFVGTRRRMKAYEGRLLLAALTKRVRDVLALMQLTAFFEIHETVEGALVA
jgi:anti-sigma B factor antagonist